MKTKAFSFDKLGFVSVVTMQAAAKKEEGDNTFHVTALSAASAPLMYDIEQSVARAPWSQSLIQSEFSLPYSRSYGVKSDSLLVGFIVTHFLAPEGHILNLGVMARWQRHGVGKLLVETVLNEAVKASVQKVFLEVRSSNTAAIKLYEGQGFKKQGIRKKYYSDNNEDAIVYAIELRSIPLRSVAS